MNMGLEKDIETSKKIISTFNNTEKNFSLDTANVNKPDLNNDEAIFVTVQIHRAGDLFTFENNNLDLKVGSAVIINTDSGTALGYVIKGPYREKIKTIFPDDKVQKIIRIANNRDFEEVHRTLEKEAPAFDFCLERIKTLELDMKLVKVRYLFGCKKALFYFTADGRVDFRQLVKDLVSKYRIRIELRQIGVRDETKILGGVASCGRELCCTSFSRKFPTVSIKMGKEQNLSLNPTKISGICGRLLCCLSYEHAVYKELGKGVPKVGKRCQLDNRTGKILNMNILAHKAQVLLDEGGIITVNIAKLTPLSKDKVSGQDKVIPSTEEKQFSEIRMEFADLDLVPYITTGKSN